MAEYCANSRSSSCEGKFLLAWPSAGFSTWLTVYMLRLAWISRLASWQDLYGVSTERALTIDGHKPGKIHSARLDRHKAGIDLFGSVRFGGSRTGLSFPGLDKQHARRAVYWANEGRFRIDGETGAAR
jgi:hypothetical protein